MIPTAPRIGLLPEHLIDQIKAGEVIDRPGNLIKEILENAIDAGATRLELTLKNNGLDLINLRDNGHGIDPADIGLAFSRHATSKIQRFEDLYRLGSYGFRGEALASIAAISRVQCISFRKDHPEGVELRIEGGQTLFQAPREKSGTNQGTQLNIQDLFFNTPVRLKFIQSQQAEKNFLRKIVYSFVAAHPLVEFILKFDDEEKLVFSAKKSFAERLLDLVPRGRDQLQEASRTYEDNSLQLLLLPGQLRAPVKLQNIYINGRFVLDKQLGRIVSNALQVTLGHDDFQYLLFLSLPTDHIDVNVHPSKTVIKIFESSKLIGLITGTIKELAAKPATPPTRGTAGTSSQEFVLPAAEGLLQERHAYNMDGFFSPHSLPQDRQELIWVGQHFLLKLESRWKAVHAPGLLERYVQQKLACPPGTSIPLLVSEPFRCGDVDRSRLEKLTEQGLELEYLSSETIVLRSIPDWLNGMPLRPVVEGLLLGRALSLVHVEPEEWPQSLWSEMLTECPEFGQDLATILEKIR